MRIVLVRHGRPDFDDGTPIPGHQLGNWVRGYDAAPLDAAQPPSTEALLEAERAECVLSSDLRRATESAALLARERAPLEEPIFREAELPSAIRLGFRMGPQRWALLARLAWFCGWSPHAESRRDAAERAEVAVARLEALVERHRSVLLVGHGIMNGMIGRGLRARGWRGPGARGGRYWSTSVFLGPSPRG